jgi:hypothetical protein
MSDEEVLAVLDAEDAFPLEEVERSRRRAWILSFAKPMSHGAEFGVFRGHFSEVIARTIRPKRLYLVDPWTKLGEKFEWGDTAYTNFNRLTTAQALADTKRRMIPFQAETRVQLLEDTTEGFCANFALFADRGLDFAYLDTSHTYDDTLRQLIEIEGILADDGVIMGDDWYSDRAHRHHGVFRAVHQFVRDYSFEIVVAGSDAQYCIRRAL